MRWRVAPHRVRHTLWNLHLRRVDPWLCNLTGYTVCIYPPACESRRFRAYRKERYEAVLSRPMNPLHVRRLADMLADTTTKEG